MRLLKVAMWQRVSSDGIDVVVCVPEIDSSYYLHFMPLNRPSFFEDVWEVVRHVPKGRVTTYGAIAETVLMIIE